MSTNDGTQICLCFLWIVKLTVGLDLHQNLTFYFNPVCMYEWAHSSVASSVASELLIEQPRKSNRINYTKRWQVQINYQDWLLLIIYSINNSLSPSIRGIDKGKQGEHWPIVSRTFIQLPRRSIKTSSVCPYSKYYVANLTLHCL